MKDRCVVVHAAWDAEARVYVATSDDVPGLVTEADTVEALFEKLRVLIPELMEENALSFDHDPELPVCVMSERLENIRINN